MRYQVRQSALRPLVFVNAIAFQTVAATFCFKIIKTDSQVVFSQKPHKTSVELCDVSFIFCEPECLMKHQHHCQCIKWLLRKDPSHRWSFSEWQVDELAPGAALVRYRAVRSIPQATSSGARHLSLWKLDGTGRWQLWFHQSTKIA